MGTGKQQELIEQDSKQGKQRLFVSFHHSHALNSLFKLTVENFVSFHTRKIVLKFT